jgi:DivIVA domain-containing protein
VDNYLRAIRDTFLGVNKPPVRSDDLRGKQFPSTEGLFEASPGYDKTEVDAFIEKAAWRLAAVESTDRPAYYLVKGLPRLQRARRAPGAARRAPGAQNFLDLVSY